MARHLVYAIVALIALSPAFLNGQTRGRRGSSSRVPTHPEAYKGVVITFHGALKKLTKKELIIESADNHELLTFRRNKNTKFLNGDVEIKPTDVDLESQVTIDASEDVDLKLMAMSINVTPAKNDGNETKPK